MVITSSGKNFLKSKVLFDNFTSSDASSTQIKFNNIGKSKVSCRGKGKTQLIAYV